MTTTDIPQQAPTFDVFIIGGGVNGCGIARDAAGRGLSIPCTRYFLRFYKVVSRWFTLFRVLRVWFSA